MNEAEFAKRFEDYLQTRSGSSPFSEVLTSSGMPDFVLITAAREGASSSSYDADAIARLTNGRAAIAAALSLRRGHRLDYIAKTTGRDVEYVRRGVAELVSVGLAVRDESGLVRLGPRWPEHLPQLEVFELKLSDWKKALAQSLRYRRLAKRVTVVMPARLDLRAERIVSFYSQYGVGLAHFDPDSADLTYVLRPRAIGPTYRGDYLDAVGRLAGRLAADSSASC